MAHRNGSRNLSEAIDELERTAREKGSDFKDKIFEQIEDLKKSLDDMKPRVEEEVTKVKKQVENKVQENPWATLGIVGLICFVIGWIFASSRRD